MTDDKKPAALALWLTGPNVTKEATEEAGRRLVALADAIAEEKGLPAGMFVAGDPLIGCDSCDVTRPWDDEGHGWVRTADGHDYCPECIVTKP